jgi:SAM-dependent methyltransferase
MLRAVDPTRDLLERLRRLRELFLDERRAAALPDYWRDARDLAAYDAVLGARIGWKWDAVLAECRDRGWPRADAATVLDHGCGSGVAARAFVAAFGAREVLCHDRSRAAMAFAVERLRAQLPAVAARTLPALGDVRPDVLLVSHVLGELDPDGEQQLRGLIARSARVVWVEPGARAVSRRLSAIRDELLGTFRVVAPCPHRARCPALAREHDWCHFFAAPPPEAFTAGFWAITARELGIDLRALPYAFLALERVPVVAPPPSVPPPPHRVLGRASVGKHDARVQLCTEPDLVDAVVTKRAQPELWRALKKRPEALRQLPP